MTKKELGKKLSDLYMTIEEIKGDIECRLDVLDDKETMTDKQEEEHTALNELIELLNEVREKIEEI